MRGAPMPVLKRSVLALGLAAWAMLCSCGSNPMTSGLPPASACAACYQNRPPEALNVPGIFYSPQNDDNIATNFTTGASTFGSGAYLDTGTGWLYAAAAPGGAGGGLDHVGTFSPLACDLPANLTTTESHYYNSVWLRGGNVAGQLGDQFSSNPNDYYVRFEGHFYGDASNDCGTSSSIPNGSTQYMELPIFFNTNGGPGVDVSNYHGFSFWTRGTGNFSVCLLSGSQGGSPAAPGPYIQLNLYQYLFNNYLTGSDQWRQVTVYFSDMTQTYGLATSQQAVLKDLYGLQFMQMGSPGPPVQADFWLDVDYIRFF